MLRVASQHLKEVGVLKRLIFAVATLPNDLPNLWEVAAKFASNDRSCIDAEQAKLLIDNLHEFDAGAFATDESLLQDLLRFQVPKYKPVGMVLISSSEKCLICGSKLLLRKDRPAAVVIYDDIMGSVPGTHYHKYCTNSSCKLTQYYGYYTIKGSSAVFYNPDWESLPYFVSSRESAFSISLLKRFNAEIFVSVSSFMQCADIYNLLHNYETSSSSR